MSTFKTILLYLFGGFILGDVAATFIGRRYVAWYHTPGSPGETVQAQFPQKALDIMGELMSFQFIGGAIGAVAGLIVGILVVRALGRRAAAKTPATPGPNTPAPKV